MSDFYSSTEIWQQLETLVAEEGSLLFDVDMPGKSSQTLRVFIASGSVDSESVDSESVDSETIGETGKVDSPGATLQQCSAVSRKISNHPFFDELLQQARLEVSSPGVNRRLRRTEHFVQAVGERIRVKSRGETGQTVTGTLLSCNGQNIEVENETDRRQVEISLGDIDKARVDFLFD